MAVVPHAAHLEAATLLGGQGHAVPQFSIAFELLTVWENVEAAFRLRVAGVSAAAVGVVVVLHDSAADLQRLLRSLELVAPAPQLVVVDAGSSDDGPGIARAFGAEVIEAGDVGFGAANNLGVARVTGTVTLLLNPDVVVHDGPVVERLARHARREDALHVPRLLNPDGSVFEYLQTR